MWVVKINSIYKLIESNGEHNTYSLIFELFCPDLGDFRQANNIHNCNCKVFICTTF